MYKVVVVLAVAAASPLFPHRQHESVDLEQHAADASIKFSRSVSDVASGFKGSATFDKGCASSDAYGSNDCAWNWGDSVKITASAAAGADVGTGAKFVVDAKVDSIVPFKVTCAACGANCTYTVPIVKKEMTIAMPDCPLIAKATPLAVEYTLALPASSPLPVKVSAKGTASLEDANGATLVSVSFDATVE